MTAALVLQRAQILALRRRHEGLDARRPHGPEALRGAAWAGLQDSMPRAALLSLHARVEGIGPDALTDPTLVQVWGPRMSVFVVAERDRGVFTVGRRPDDARRRARADELARRLRDHLGDEARSYAEVGRELGLRHGNELRIATTTGTVVLAWAGARRPLVRCVPAPEITPDKARLELARRYLHVFGPGTAEGFAEWAGLRPRPAAEALTALRSSLTPVRTPIGEGWLLAADEATARLPPQPAAGVRLLPSGDTHYLAQGAERELLVERPEHRQRLWTSRVWPGAVLLDGEIRGTWRRARETVTVSLWGRSSRAQRDAIEAEAAALPLPGLSGPGWVNWDA